jgi:acetyltransferase-like isoleucine patch superfamily enzyme
MVLDASMIKILKSEVFAWTEALLAAVPGRLGRLLRSLYWPLRLNAVARPFSIGRNVEIAAPENISLGSDVYIVDGAVIRAELGRLVCGDRLAVNGGARIIADFGEIIMGRGVMIGPGVLIRASNHASGDIDRFIWDQGQTGGKIEIGDDVWIAGQAVILPGVKIGNHAIVAAASVVTQDVPDFAVVGGAPARVIRDRRSRKGESNV